jgi:hypothetical protein
MAREATHRVCEDHQRLSIGDLARGGLLTGSGTLTWSGGSGVAIDGSDDHIKLTYAVDGKKVQERISISKTPVHLGGRRSWFVCPGCDRRIAALYFAGSFRCRHCHDLRYRSQRETPRHRAISRIQRARKKLGGSGTLMKPTPARPRYMHNVTYQRLLMEEVEAWQAYTSTPK